MRVKTYTFMGTYLYGHPQVERQRINCFLKLKENELVVIKQQLISGGELFRLPYEKIESVSTDIEKEWKGTRLALGWVALGPLGSFLIGKKKREQLGIVVKGKDKEGNEVQIPIVFAPIKHSARIKGLLDQKIGQAREITI